jgi:hypothetical protein
MKVKIISSETTDSFQQLCSEAAKEGFLPYSDFKIVPHEGSIYFIQQWVSPNSTREIDFLSSRKS